MKISGEDYCIECNPSEGDINFYGSLLLNGAEEYVPIVQLLNDVVDQQPTTIKLNVQKLKMLNSSGYQMLSKFVMRVRHLRDMRLSVRGNSEISWQIRSLKNLKRLMPTLEIEFES